jgi:hypothetical protein
MTTEKIISTIRPGLLVSLNIRIAGNVSYNKRDLERRHREEDGTERARWETERVVVNPQELRRAERVRGAARQLIGKTCARSSFGLLCPNAWEKDLYANIAEARRMAGEFNAKAQHTEVSVNVLVGRVAQDDVEAVRAINSEVRSLLREMTDGIKELDVKRVRDAAGRARSVGAMLSEDAAKKVKLAIDAARASAKKIVKAGEEAAGAIDKEAIKQIQSARTAFLDLDPTEVLPAKPTAAGRAVDLEPEAETPARPAKAAGKKMAATQLDLEDAIAATPKPKAKKKAKAREVA